MKTVFVFLSSVLLLSALAIFELQAQQPSSKSTTSSSNWKAVDEAMGRTGQDQPDGTHKFSMPRSDLKVTLDGVGLKPGLALGSWAAFQKMGNQTEVMGDLVLAENEVGPVMQKLSDSGIEITACECLPHSSIDGKVIAGGKPHDVSRRDFSSGTRGT